MNIKKICALSFISLILFSYIPTIQIVSAVNETAEQRAQSHARIIYSDDEYTLTLNVDPVSGGSVSRDNPGPYNSDDVVQLTASENPGYAFDHWEGDLTGSINPDSITITGHMVVTAVFTPLYDRVDINILSQTIGNNKLSLGIMADWECIEWREDNVRRDLIEDANFKIIRIFDFRPTNPELMPCTYWNEATQTGTWDWSEIDSMIQSIFDIGAEPLICLGWAHSNTAKYIPNGMQLNPTTQLPAPETYAAYCAEWVEHFNSNNMPVKYYEIFNEPFSYFGWVPDQTKLNYFTNVWNECARQMRAKNPNVQLSFDFITARNVFDYWVVYGEDIDFLSCHKYDTNTGEVPGYTDATIFSRAETQYFETQGSFYGFDEAKQRWLSQRGSTLDILITESNMNSAWEDGTDPRIQTMSGAVRTALVLRQCILEGVKYHVYYCIKSRSSLASQRETEGIGFGIIDFDTNEPWYPYFVHEFIGNNLAEGDQITSTTSSTNDVRSIAWTHNGITNLLLISKTSSTKSLFISGASGNLNYWKIDESIPYQTPAVQTGQTFNTNPITAEGYAVILVQVQEGTSPSEIVLDDTDASFTGTWGGPSSSVSGYQGTGYRYHEAGTGSNIATWTPIITQTGTWEVLAKWTSYDNRATDAPYVIIHAGGTTTRRVNQEINGGTWYSLGNFNFNTGSTTITLSDDANDYVIADAIRLVYVGP